MQIANIENVLLTSAVTLSLANQTEGFTITGSAGDDTITGGSGADSISSGSGDDIIIGAQNDTLLDGGGDTDQLNVGAGFTSSSDAQIANIENVLLTSAVALSLANQTESFTITGSSGADSITGGLGADIIIGAQNDTLLNGGGGADQLNVGAGFSSSSDAQIANIENVLLTSAVTLNLANQTEGFTINGSSGADSITGGLGADIIIGAQNNSLLNGGGGTDQLNVGANFTSASNGQLINIEDILLTSAVALSLANQTESFTITGSSGADSITGGLGADIIIGTQNDTLLNGGGGTDQLNVGADFTSTSNAQIANIENVLLTSAVTLSLANQTEGFTVTGSSGEDTITGGTEADSISAGSGNDTIAWEGGTADTLLDGGANTDQLNVGADFSSSSDAQIANIENVLLTSDVTLNLANQTENFIITGSAGDDSITGGSGADSISAGSGFDTIAGAQNDTLLDGGADTDQLKSWGRLHQQLRCADRQYREH